LQYGEPPSRPSIGTAADHERTAPLSPDERAELELLRARIAELEREHVVRIAAANAAVAAAQDRLYWLDRWHVDLNALMAKPGAAELRGLLRAIRAIVRAVRKLLG
jgi:hypothetical protein